MGINLRTETVASKVPRPWIAGDRSALYRTIAALCKGVRRRRWFNAPGARCARRPRPLTANGLHHLFVVESMAGIAGEEALPTVDGGGSRRHTARLCSV